MKQYYAEDIIKNKKNNAKEIWHLQWKGQGEVRIGKWIFRAVNYIIIILYISKCTIYARIVSNEDMCFFEGQARGLALQATRRRQRVPLHH